MTLLPTVLFCFIIQSLLLYSSTLSRYCEVGLFCHLVYKFASSLGTLDIFFPFDLLRYLEGELPSLHLWFYVCLILHSKDTWNVITSQLFVHIIVCLVFVNIWKLLARKNIYFVSIYYKEIKQKHWITQAI